MRGIIDKIKAKLRSKLKNQETYEQFLSFLMISATFIMLTIFLLILDKLIIPKYQINMESNETEVIYNRTSILPEELPLIYSMKYDRFLLVFYDSDNVTFDLDFIKDYGSKLGFNILLYDINNPWFYVELADGIVIHLAPAMPINSILCYDKEVNKSIIIFEPLIRDKQNLMLFFDACLDRIQ